MKTFEQFINEITSGEVFSPMRNVPVVFNPKDHPELANEFFDLISIAYSELGGHAKIQKPEDILNDPKWNFWEGMDIHYTSDFDLLIFGQKTKYGVKLSGVGHDGTMDAKVKFLNQEGKKLHNLGYYVEVSGKLAKIFINYDCPTVDNQEEVEKVLGKSVEWKGKNPYDENQPGNSWYTRTIGGKQFAKILLGRPKNI